MSFAFIAEMEEANERMPREGRFPVIFMCEMLEVSGRVLCMEEREPSERQQEDVRLTTLLWDS